MPRRGLISRREVSADPLYNSALVTKFINCMMYGGKRATWVKKSSPRFELGRHHYEYHWYEHPGIGRVELKRKQVH